MMERLQKFVAVNYGSKSSINFKLQMDDAYDEFGKLTENGRSKVKDMLILILQREISRTYKVPLTAFTAFDPEGNNFVTVNDIVNSKMAYRLPFTKDELRYLLERETVFKRVPRLNIDLFIKYMFPEKLRGGANNED